MSKKTEKAAPAVLSERKGAARGKAGRSLFPLPLLIIYMCLLTFAPASAQGTGKDDYDYLRGVEAYEQEEYQEAAKYLAQALETDDENAYAYGHMGRVYSQLGFKGSALNCFRLGLKYLPAKDKAFQSKIHRWRADAYWALGDSLKAMEEVQAAVRLNPTEGEYFCTRGILHCYSKEYDAARADLETALRLDTADVSILHYLTYVSVARRDWPEALRWGEEALRRDSTGISTYINCIKARYCQGQTAEAAGVLARAWHFCGVQDSVMAWTDTLAKSGYAATVQALEEARLRWRDDPDLLYAKSLAAYMTRRRQTALDLAERYVKEKDGEEWQIVLAWNKEAMDDYEGAWECLRRAWQADSIGVTIVPAMGDCLAGLGRYEESLAYYNKAIAGFPLIADGYGGRQFAYRRLGKMEAALDDALHYQALAPQKAHAQMSVARCLLRMGRAGEARPYLEEAVSLDSVPLGSTQRMFALLYLGRTAEAENWCRKTLEADEAEVRAGRTVRPDNAAYFNAARFYARLGDTAQALAFMRRALDYGCRHWTEIRQSEELASLQGTAAFEALIEEYKNKPAVWE